MQSTHTELNFLEAYQPEVLTENPTVMNRLDNAGSHGHWEKETVGLEKKSLNSHSWEVYLVYSPSAPPCRNLVEANNLYYCWLQVWYSLAGDCTSENVLTERVSLHKQFGACRWSTIYFVDYKDHWSRRFNEFLYCQKTERNCKLPQTV